MLESIHDRVAREDLVTFVNASFACTGQREFYGDAGGQRVSIDFLHRYILGNYRRLYARTLAAGINHFNQAQIVGHLLATGRDAAAASRREEGALIGAALRRLPPQRVYRLFETLRRRGVNNRRTRAVVRDYLAGRPDPAFDAVKYRRRVRAAVAHTHLALGGELARFLFGDRTGRRFDTPLFETYRRAHFARDAVFELPFTIAEGLAAKHGIERAQLLARGAAAMTGGEKLRLQQAAARERKPIDLGFDLGRAPLTRLASYVVSLSVDERRARTGELHAALTASAARAALRTPYPLGRVVLIADRSYSSSGSTEKRRRPLAVALAASYLLRAAAREAHVVWTPAWDRDDCTVTAGGQTDLARPLVAALGFEPELIVIVSDGHENAPPGTAAQVVAAYRAQLPGAPRVTVVHANPVFDAEHLAPRALGAPIPTVGIRDAEDLLTMIGFARFADGGAPLAELEDYLSVLVARMLTTAEAT